MAITNWDCPAFESRLELGNSISDPDCDNCRNGKTEYSAVDQKDGGLSVTYWAGTCSLDPQRGTVALARTSIVSPEGFTYSVIVLRNHHGK